MIQPRHLILRPEFRAQQGEQGEQGKQGEAPPPFVPRDQAGDPTAEPPPPGTRPDAGPLGACGGTDTMFMVLAMVAIFYFLLIRPQQKQEKQRRAMLAAIKEGDRVVTTGGIHGTISSLSENTVTLRVDPKVKLTVDRQNVARIEGGEKVEKAPPPKT